MVLPCGTEKKVYANLKNTAIWQFPKIGAPLDIRHHPFVDGIFPNKRHPSIGEPSDCGKPVKRWPFAAGPTWHALPGFGPAREPSNGQNLGVLVRWMLAKSCTTERMVETC